MLVGNTFKMSSSSIILEKTHNPECPSCQVEIVGLLTHRQVRDITLCFH